MCVCARARVCVLGGLGVGGAADVPPWTTATLQRPFCVTGAPAQRHRMPVERAGQRVMWTERWGWGLWSEPSLPPALGGGLEEA